MHRLYVIVVIVWWANIVLIEHILALVHFTLIHHGILEDIVCVINSLLCLHLDHSFVHREKEHNMTMIVVNNLYYHIILVCGYIYLTISCLVSC